ncbi:polyphosphate--glucose phosphotransferase [Thioflexithrix psekupsensis]|uniref:Polyphosphate glucokinase n=1 Tax=Thioflexithrix psekupsensis TaxID=1570016 RepID=A0A251XDM2_9GAMM|nr:ROK family protein [Thioflexithrix psekupsensis]OUD16320.1 polyphosphate glucokinase [Thioflexithrix psekupsensis]
MEFLGIDIGGSGIKGAPVDLQEGGVQTERHRIATPQPATPEAVAQVVAELVAYFNWQGQIGCTFPSVIKQGVAHTAANVDSGWIGLNAERLFSERCQRRVYLLNDADAAGLAEMRYGAGRGQSGLVIMLTLGTGIGSAIFYRGQLLPNTEFGHLQIRGKDAEHRASARVRQEKNWGFDKWSLRVSEFLVIMENLFWPDLFIIGGGISRKHEKFLPLLTCRTPVVPAQLQNNAGIIGAALAASLQFEYDLQEKPFLHY